MTRLPAGSLVFALLTVAACDTHRPLPRDGSSPSQPKIEVRAAHGELVFGLDTRGGGRFEVTPVAESALTVLVTPESITVSRDGAEVMTLRKNSTGYQGPKLRIAESALRGSLHVIDAIGVTQFSAEAGSGGTLGRDAGGTPILEAIASQREPDRVVIERPGGGVRLGTVHGVPVGSQQTLIAAILGAPTLPIESRAAAAAFVLSR
jgi:hypothetical protein